MICCFTINSFLNMSLPTAGMVIGWVCMVLNVLKITIIFNAYSIIEIICDCRISSVRLDGLNAVLSVALILSLVDLGASVMLILGVNKGKHLYLLPWLVNNGIGLAFLIFLGIGFILNILSSILLFLPDVCAALIVLSILVFCCMVWNTIYSLFQSIRESNEGRVLNEERNDSEVLDVQRPGENSYPFKYDVLRNEV